MTRSTRPAFTLIELLVVISIIALLVSILLPALAQSRAAARGVLCKSNLKGWGAMMEVYHADNKQQYPMAVNYCTTLGEHVAPGGGGYANYGRAWWVSLNPISGLLKGSVTFNSNRRYSATPLQCPDVASPSGAIREYYTNPAAMMAGGGNRFDDYGLPQYAMNAGFGLYDYYSTVDPSYYTWKGHLRDVDKPARNVSIIDAHVYPYANYTSANYVVDSVTGSLGAVYGAVVWAFMPPHVSRPDLNPDSNSFVGARGGYRHAQALNALHMDGHVSEYGESSGDNATRNAADKARFTMDKDVFPGYAAGWQSSYTTGLP